MFLLYFILLQDVYCIIVYPPTCVYYITMTITLLIVKLYYCIQIVFIIKRHKPKQIMVIISIFNLRLVLCRWTSVFGVTFHVLLRFISFTWGSSTKWCTMSVHRLRTNRIKKIVMGDNIFSRLSIKYLN